MATVPTQVRIDENLKKQATELFSQLGMDMSSAMNIFLRQCVMRGGLPFDVRLPRFNRETEDAIQEARDIMSGKIETKSYNSSRELFDELDAE